ncbi:DNA-binding transcriptional regulator, LysR family [Stigmatella aurantiaca]|uniref:DNA-binding transcriptional regulator, LysR family n=1 Tax=Stigmatella aurantiaca TaxID=41 RepID=A0A1H7XHG7_STIAU|nr:LysR family transcriptional regulator [Stigmatella aurantiaca]SEM33200.1 DNA-binding transcriptional regulator, LysR family [Stigmatella aurantiaca]
MKNRHELPRADLTELTAFAAIAAHRSFRKAAEELRVSPSTLSHTLRSLEERVGVRLLHRTTRSVATTQAGEALLGRLRPLLREFDNALSEVDAFRDGPQGMLRINTSLIGARLLLRKAVPAFLARCPEMQVDLVTEGRLVDIIAEGFDAGVRLGEAVPRDMIAVGFGGQARFVAVASPAYLKRRPAPRTPHELHQHACIRYRLRSGKIYRWEFEKRTQALAVDVPGPLTLDDDDLMVQAALDGLGIAFVPEQAAERALKAGTLVAVLSDWCPPFPGLFLYYPGHRQVPAGLRAFIDVLKETEARPS